MNKLIVIGLLLISTVATYGQSIDNVNHIVEFLGQEKYDNTLEVNPGKIKYLSAFESKGYAITELPADKKVDVVELVEVKLKCIKNIDQNQKKSLSIDEFINASNSESFNILMYDFKPDPNKPSMYKLGNSGKILIIQSTKTISRMANKIEL